MGMGHIALVPASKVPLMGQGECPRERSDTTESFGGRHLHGDQDALRPTWLGRHCSGWRARGNGKMSWRVAADRRRSGARVPAVA